MNYINGKVLAEYMAEISQGLVSILYLLLVTPKLASLYNRACGGKGEKSRGLHRGEDGG